MPTIHDFYIPHKERKTTIKELISHFDKDTAIIIEDGLYDHTEQFCHHNSFYKMIATAIYKDNKRNILFNCERGGQTMKRIKKSISKDEFNPYNLAFLRPDELDKDQWIRIIVRMNTMEEKLNNLPTVSWKPCYRCKGTEYSKYQLQTRSVDEPMTTFYTCKQCGKNYSFSL